MQETDTRPLSQLVIDLHNIARDLERKVPLSVKAEAMAVRRIADRIAFIERIEHTL